MAIPKKPRARPTKPGKAHRVPADTSDTWTTAFVAASTPPLKRNTGHAQGTPSGGSACPVVPDIDAQLDAEATNAGQDGVKSTIPNMSGSKTAPKVLLKNHKLAPERLMGHIKIPTPKAYPTPIILEHILDNDTTRPPSFSPTIPPVNTAELITTLSCLELENCQLQAHTTDGVKKVDGWKAHVHDLAELISDRNFEIADKNSSELIRLRNLYNESVGVYHNKLNPLKLEAEGLRSFVGKGRNILQFHGREQVWEAGVQGFVREVSEGKRELLEVEKKCEVVVEVARMREEMVALKARIEGLKEVGWGLTVKLAALQNVGL